MVTNYLTRHQLIQNFVKKNGANAFVLWEQMAIEIISIIGEEGFHSLYERSEFIVRQTFSWLATPSLPQTDQQLSKLKSCLDEQPSSESSKANLMLLTTFTDVLALLIGEQLTLRILDSAWDLDSLSISAQETKDEQ